MSFTLQVSDVLFCHDCELGLLLGCGPINYLLTARLLQALDDEAVASLIPGLTSVLPTAAVPLLVPTVTEGTKAAPASTTTGELQPIILQADACMCTPASQGQEPCMSRHSNAWEARLAQPPKQHRTVSCRHADALQLMRAV